MIFVIAHSIASSPCFDNARAGKLVSMNLMNGGSASVAFNRAPTSSVGAALHRCRWSALPGPDENHIDDTGDAPA
jgi:hypothetical protein